ncbi:MAG TPA: calcium/proton exchanger [Halanaerobiales bacterium]|nr:calcium/proton exchanger [Halanaerobiales bacterium]HPZ62129.1 calcium/proton exchanger [Halanaerobiales bacterium]HQD03374.1 calcium/proton exchanger [Halanaerobiales bacterium]
MLKKLKILYIFIPISLILFYLLQAPLASFLSSALAIIPLAALMSHLTDQIRHQLGSSWGGLINISFANATELIISLFAIYDGLFNVVKANITGSIIMNLLLVLGLSFFLGGLKYQRQEFDKLLAITNSVMLMLAVIGMLIPAIFYYGSAKIKTVILGRLSLGVGLVLFITYLAGLYFTLIFHEQEKEEGEAKRKGSAAVSGTGRTGPEKNKRGAKKSWPYSSSLWKKILFLFLTTILIALEAHILINSLSSVQEVFKISPVFIGVIILPLISNMAENLTAIKMARENKIDLSISIAVGSSIQVALFLVPLLIFISHLIKQPMNILFNILEISSIGLSVLAINIVYLQGKSNWFEGLQLIAAYLIIAIAFYFA